jgi:hypothetical protein
MFQCSKSNMTAESPCSVENVNSRLALKIYLTVHETHFMDSFIAFLMAGIITLFVYERILQASS